MILSAISVRAWSQEMGWNWPEPLGPTLLRGDLTRKGPYMVRL
jgi:hypothetical protein